jgi:1,4-alpha-glucan branching enzyme
MQDIDHAFDQCIKARLIEKVHTNALARAKNSRTIAAIQSAVPQIKSASFIGDFADWRGRVEWCQRPRQPLTRRLANQHAEAVPINSAFPTARRMLARRS